VWLRTTTFGDDKDRVLMRSGGEPTYFAADLAYMANKRERGYERQLLPVGADHHGYVARLKAAFHALGNDPDLLETLIIQFVHLVEGDARAAMSKRRGEFVTLDALLDEIGVDATRFFMLQSSHDRTLDLNLDLARSSSAENPVYYIQYAHARTASMLVKLGDERVAAAVAAGADWTLQGSELHTSERELIKKLLDLPEEIADAAERRAPHRVAAYALELAQVFTAFYRDCKVVGAEPEATESFRIALCVASRTQLALVLDLLGVSAPDSM
jgi:arginyl-tRNA synthetase